MTILLLNGTERCVAIPGEVLGPLAFLLAHRFRIDH